MRRWRCASHFEVRSECEARTTRTVELSRFFFGRAARARALKSVATTWRKVPVIALLCKSLPLRDAPLQAQLLTLQSSTQFLPQIMQIFDQSQSSYALLIAGTSLNGTHTLCRVSRLGKALQKRIKPLFNHRGCDD